MISSSPFGLNTLILACTSGFNPFTNFPSSSPSEISVSSSARDSNHCLYSLTEPSYGRARNLSSPIFPCVAWNLLNTNPFNSSQSWIFFLCCCHWYQERASPSKQKAAASIFSNSEIWVRLEYLWALNTHPSGFSPSNTGISNLLFLYSGRHKTPSCSLCGSPSPGCYCWVPSGLWSRSLFWAFLFPFSFLIIPAVHHEFELLHHQAYVPYVMNPLHFRFHCFYPSLNSFHFPFHFPTLSVSGILGTCSDTKMLIPCCQGKPAGRIKDIKAIKIRK